MSRGILGHADTRHTSQYKSCQSNPAQRAWSMRSVVLSSWLTRTSAGTLPPTPTSIRSPGTSSALAVGQHLFSYEWVCAAHTHFYQVAGHQLCKSDGGTFKLALAPCCLRKHCMCHAASANARLQRWIHPPPLQHVLLAAQYQPSLTRRRQHGPAAVPQRGGHISLVRFQLLNRLFRIRLRDDSHGGCRQAQKGTACIESRQGMLSAHQRQWRQPP